MKLTIRAAIIATAALMAAPTLTACGPGSTGGTPASTTPEIETPAVQNPTPASSDDCEVGDFAEGDWLADCYGVGDPEAENGHVVPPSKSKPSPTPSCKRGEKVRFGKCIKVRGARR